jgi:DNA polymerase I-like protein with 3'-5' exonuclease and polymerase domains
MYSWRTYDAPSFLKKRGIIDTFSPPELKNYPVQGTGGEIVQLVLGKLWRYFMKKDNWNGKAFLVNTVHDCVWFDMDASVAEEVLKTAKIIMEGVPTYLKKHFNIDCPVPFPVDVEMGRNMLDLHHLEA